MTGKRKGVQENKKVNRGDSHSYEGSPYQKNLKLKLLQRNCAMTEKGMPLNDKKKVNLILFTPLRNRDSAGQTGLPAPHRALNDCILPFSLIQGHTYELSSTLLSYFLISLHLRQTASSLQ